MTRPSAMRVCLVVAGLNFWAFSAQGAPPPPTPAPTASGRRSNPGSGSGGRSGDAAVAQTGSGKGGATGVAKTLKCGECGTLNRPTEWYCERCGAELAGI